MKCGPRGLLTALSESVTQSWEQEATSRRAPTRDIFHFLICLLWLRVHQWKHADETDEPTYIHLCAFTFHDLI